MDISPAAAETEGGTTQEESNHAPLESAVHEENRTEEKHAFPRPVCAGTEHDHARARQGQDTKLRREGQKMEVRAIANRRMILINLVNSDQFYNLTARAQAIYIQAIANADDEGFCDKVHSIRKRMNARISDVDLLVDKGYLYRFSRDLYLIVHWRCHNHIRRDRGSETFHKAERNRVCVCPDDTYHVLPSGMDSEEVRQYAAEHCMIPMTAFFFDRGGHTAVESKVMQSNAM